MDAITFSSPFEQIRTLQDRGRSIFFIPNPGNHGDSLITAATLQKFEEYGITYRILPKTFDHAPGNVYVYAGGGNFIPIYSHCSQVVATLSKLKAKLIILPHSCFGVTDQIAGYEGELTIWARERKTQDYLSRVKAKKFQYGLADDIAIGLRLEDRRFYYFHMSHALNALRSSQAGGGAVLQAFRKDVETLHHSLPFPKDKNFDISAAYPNPSSVLRGFDIGFLDQRLLFGHASWFLSWINQFETIHTDRLHVGIASVLLGKQVHLYDNSYGKVRAVYEYSLQARPGIKITPHW